MERSTISQNVQIGVEATPGVAVAATRKLQSISIEPSFKFETQQFRPLGTKFNTISITNKEWSEASLSGVLDFNEIVYPLSSVLTTSAAVTGTTAKTWLFTPSSTAADTPKTFTVEQGSSVRGHRMPYGLVTELGFEFSRDEITIDGSMIGQKLTDPFTLTSSGVTTATQAVASAAKIDVYLDSTSGGLGTTKLTRALKGSWKIGDRFNPLWVLNSANASWVTHVEGEPNFEITLLLEADAEGMAPLSTLRSGTTQFLRFAVTGDLIDGSDYYGINLDSAIKITDVGEFSDEDGVYAIEFTATGVHDGTWGKALQVEVINTLAAL